MPATESSDALNLRAAQLMGHLYEAFEAAGYGGRYLERLIMRILFCLFAEDSGILEPGIFSAYLARCRDDGADVGGQLDRFFRLLNTPLDRRPGVPDPLLARLPYIGGPVFQETLPPPAGSPGQRQCLPACAEFDWSTISPAVFGSLFQAVKDPGERRQIGTHYTSEADILKVIRPLFLDDLRAEFTRARGNVAQLNRLHDKLAELRVLDPACGCGNFLVTVYREVRMLELEVLMALQKAGDTLTTAILRVSDQSRVDVDQFYGIEQEEFPAGVAQMALWLVDHQISRRFAQSLGSPFVRPPLRKTPPILVGNALRLDWRQLLPPDQCTCVLGNPPFVGKHRISDQQAEDMALVAPDLPGIGTLDYVCGWFLKAADYIRRTPARVGFVSTNSITQGEQVGILWNELFQRHQVKIHFAYRTFAWQSDALGKAHVHVVIIGFGQDDPARKHLYHQVDGQFLAQTARNLSPYLVEGADIALTARRRPLCPVPDITYGSKPVDSGHLILADDERAPFLAANPAAEPYLKPLLSAEEFLRGAKRWALWLADAPAAILDLPGIRSRLDAVRAFRLASAKPATRRLADVPHLFAEIRQPSSSYVVVPCHTSENRPYIPLAFVPPTSILHNSCTAVPDATLYHFGILTSAMHMAWVRQVCGRIKSDYRYSNKLVYNNFPWPLDATPRQRSTVEEFAQYVIDARARFPDHSLADLYDPDRMPADLAAAHAALDLAVDRAYRHRPFADDRDRTEHLFALYDQLTSPLARR